MPLNPRPLHPDDQPGADQEPRGFREWSHKVGDGPSGVGQDQVPFVSIADLRHPFVKLAAVAFIGYTLAKLIHGRH
ncbi:hypothetical protein [Lichenibacterium ramalinae]|jgi:hypothetical protein|uniref:Uncharacterized protein n=1 Tax=Lichenibacterium ramalinae TaxID=2316527 RepID=A0A4Q2R7K6_9HYPH|nr:hypothetical protein [Lichenibacterium ramalinae]RYB02418.1 hypothetical protein D3272_21050 [Lichenibacterium ramalinae]